MSIDHSQIDALRSSLEADDYHLQVEVSGGAAAATITAGPDACAECLVPKELMRTMLAPILGVDAERIEVTYPVDIDTAGQ